MFVMRKKIAQKAADANSSNVWKNVVHFFQRLENSVDNDTSQPQEKPVILLDLNFVPTWARQPAGKNPYEQFGGGDRRDRGERREWGGERRDRKPRPGQRPGQGQGPGPGAGRRDQRPDTRGPRDSQELPERRFERREEFLPLDISFIPERNRLSALVHELRDSARAYPLMDLASAFLSNPAYYLVKIETRQPERDKEAPNLFQCKECKVLFFQKDALTTHALEKHLEKVFVREEVKVEPPSGNFLVIARCKLSGTLLGPPNYHGYNAKLQEIWKKQFAHMSLDSYRSHIETIRDPELIEKWKQENSTQVAYKPREPEGAPALTLAEVQKIFLQEHAPTLVAEGHRFIVPAEAASRIDDARLRSAVREAWTRESHRPFSLMLALRPAFNHMGLHMFRVQSGITFATYIRPRPIDPGQTITNIAEVLQFLQAQPGCSRQELVEKLRPGIALDSPKVAEVISPLRWLIERGHVIEFFNGTLAVPTGRPRPEPSRGPDARHAHPRKN
jgi:hypothetical protein